MGTEITYSDILHLQKIVNSELKYLYEKHKSRGRELLATILLTEIEEIIERLNENGYSFGRLDYSGDINFENSEQTYRNGKEMGSGIILHFHGFSVQAYWEGTLSHE